MDDSPYRGAIGLGEYTIYLLRGELNSAVECGRELLRLAEMEHSSVESHIGHRAAGATLFHMGRFEEAHRHLEAGLAIYDPGTEEQVVHKIGYFSGVTFHSYLAHSFWHLGFADKSLKCLEHSIALTQKLQHPPSQAFALFQASFHYDYLMRNDVKALRHANESFLALAEQGGFDAWSAFVNSQQACLATEAGDIAGAPEKVLQNLEWWKGSVGVLVVPYFYALLSRTQEGLGRIKDAVCSIDTAIEWSDRFGEQCLIAELYRYKGELLGGSGSPEAQVTCFEKALTIAHDQSSRALELRAATSLARLWVEEGNRQKASDLLGPLYDWFSEGFDTADLKRAKALLDEMA
jgi:tetratricopeptide (TPR) repeat protein